MSKIKLSKQQIGRAGGLLVQYRLLKYGIDSAPLTTDSGIDLVAYSPLREEALTIQVKTNAKPKPGGGKGALALDWWLKRTSPADLVALVNLESEEVWLFTLEEFIEAAQQQSDEISLHFYMYVDGGVKTRTGKKALKYQFSEYLLENAFHRIFI